MLKNHKLETKLDPIAKSLASWIKKYSNQESIVDETTIRKSIGYFRVNKKDYTEILRYLEGQGYIEWVNFGIIKVNI